MGWLQLAGMGMDMFSSYMGNSQQNDDIEAMNEAKLEQFNANKTIVAEMLGTLSTRTSRAEYEAVRTSIRTKMNTKKAQAVAEGQATVRAAQMGTGSGTRASLATFQGSSRQAGDMITDANINLQTELTTITEHFNDTARTAIQNLNNSSPLLSDTNSTLSMLTSAAGAGLNSWDKLSQDSKEEIKNMFTKTPTNNTLVQNQGLSYANGVQLGGR